LLSSPLVQLLLGEARLLKIWLKPCLENVSINLLQHKSQPLTQVSINCALVIFGMAELHLKTLQSYRKNLPEHDVHFIDVRSLVHQIATYLAN
jgi:hypothetical protein